VANIRGQIIPVIDLPTAVGCAPKARNILLVTEYERSVQGFAVEEAEEIVRLEWSRVVSAERAAVGGMVTSLARLDEQDEKSRLALILDVETILREALPSRFRTGEEAIPPASVPLTAGSTVLCADDSSVARSQIENMLTQLGVSFIGARTGKEALARLKALAQEARSSNTPMRQKVAMAVTDLEMPEMAGFTWTRSIKEDDRLKAVPVVNRSSLSGSANESHANTAGATGMLRSSFLRGWLGK
jgi:two-component system, chemotaxis family, chemotaxis protein CheV